MNKKINPSQVQSDFPVFKNNPELAYLDSSATQLKPQVVIDKLVEYYSEYPSNIHRGIYKIAERASEEYEKSRDVVAEFIGASRDEVIFTRGTTESLNLLSYSLGQELKPNDEVVTTVMEHHANFVPWQHICKQRQAVLKIIDITDGGDLDVGAQFEKLDHYISAKTKIVTLTYVSNVLGIINPVRELISAIRQINKDIIIIIDAAQAIAHIRLNVMALGADFVVFSGHKMVGPTGVGVLWGKMERLQTLPPFHYGGDMIELVSIEETTFKQPPYKFEAGTPPIASVIAFASSIAYLKQYNFDDITTFEMELFDYTIKLLESELKDFVTILGRHSTSAKIGVVSFYLNGVHPHDVAQIASDHNVGIRAGHHCAMPLHTRLCAPASARASFYIYNTKQDVDKLLESLLEAKSLFS